MADDSEDYEEAEFENMLDTKLLAMAKYAQQPEPVKRRVRALKKLQFSYLQLEADFHEAVADLERKFAAKRQPPLLKRSEIICGNYEPNDEEADWKEDGDAGYAADDATAAKLALMLKDKVQLVEESQKGDAAKQQQQQQPLQNGSNTDAAAAAAAAAPGAEDETPVPAAAAAVAAAATTHKGVPEFWLTAMRNTAIIGDMIQAYDENALKCLTDIRVKLLPSDAAADVAAADGEQQQQQQRGFELQFMFKENEYFSNEVLTKRYYYKFRPDPNLPWEYDGPEISSCEGCDILWHKGRNLTVKIVRKVQKKKTGNQRRTITKTVPTDSFFNFFNPLQHSGDESDNDENESEPDNSLTEADYDIGCFIKEELVPKAVLYFTGDAFDDGDNEEEEEEDDDEDDDDDDDDDSDNQANAGPKPECKQQ